MLTDKLWDKLHLILNLLIFYQNFITFLLFEFRAFINFALSAPTMIDSLLHHEATGDPMVPDCFVLGTF